LAELIYGRTVSNVNSQSFEFVCKNWG